MATIEVQRPSKRLDDTRAVDLMTFTTSEGAVTGFLGPNGAGQSTTLRMLLGWSHPTSGAPRSTAADTPTTIPSIRTRPPSHLGRRRWHSPHHPQGLERVRNHFLRGPDAPGNSRYRPCGYASSPQLSARVGPHTKGVDTSHPDPKQESRTMTSTHENRTTTLTTLPVCLAIAFAAVFAVGCATDPPTTEPSPPTPSSNVTTVGRALSTISVASTAGASPTISSVPHDRVQSLLDRWASEGRGGVAVALAGHDKELTVAAAGSAGPDGGPVEPGSAFRVGSLSKTFVAVMLLQLVDDGTIGLDDYVVGHAPKLTIAKGVTIRQLLAHRSGLPEYADSELAPAVIADPARTWAPADVLKLVADQPRDFAPGAKFAYSNTNYIVAGLLLERVTGKTLAENLRSRIVEPLGLESTYFAPDDTGSPIGGFSNSLPGGDTSGASYRALETTAGAAGALVSTASDLAIFIRALAHGRLLDKQTYAQMTKGLPDTGQTLGIFAADPPSTTGISNSGNVPGFTAYMQYDPVTQDLFVLLLNDDTRSPEQLGTDLSTIICNI